MYEYNSFKYQFKASLLVQSNKSMARGQSNQTNRYFEYYISSYVLER